ncbi:MAG: hypothetical protein PHU63_01250 [Candidatus ainarchaeum sp.]|nr:hypothetical protein [Candidatus ainarchaeum sp.]
MKNVLFALLILGLVFSGAFPDTISGTQLEIKNSNGETSSGSAEYSTSDEITMVKVETESLTESQWKTEEELYISYGWSKKTSNGFEYFYKCQTYNDYYTVSEAYCFIDSYQNGVWYKVDVSILSGTQSEALDTGITVIENLTSGAGVCCPLGLMFLGIASSGLVFFNRK